MRNVNWSIFDCIKVAAYSSEMWHGFMQFQAGRSGEEWGGGGGGGGGGSAASYSAAANQNG